jgi:hypothetical protein
MGYWFITDQNGVLIAHPKASLLEKETHINLPIPEGDGNYIIKKNEITGNESLWFHASLAPLTWKLWGVFDSKELEFDTKTTRTDLFLITLSLLIGLLALTALAINPHASRRRLWYISGIYSIILACSIFSIWCIVTRYPLPTASTVPVYSKLQLYQLLDILKETKQLPVINDEIPPRAPEKDLSYYLNYRYKQDKYIPTGIFVNDIEFSSPDQIEFVGYIWQRYFDGIHDSLKRGFILPQLADNPDIKELGRIKYGKEETIVWLVRAKLNQLMSHTKYPFNVANIEIELRHADIDKNILLVPDFDAYPFLQPATLPGIGREANITGWQILQSFFGYDSTKISTNFGLYRYGPFGIYKSLQPSSEPSLVFNTTAQHYLFESLISELIPLFVIALLLFLIFITDISHGFSNLIVGIGSIFFASLLAHPQLRHKLPAYQVVYLDSFFLIMYCTILAVTIISMMHLYKSKLWLIKYRDNLIPKLLYWPLVLTATLLSTLWYLY